jgi:hypothetical protein
MRPDESGVKRLTHNHGYTPAWSPDGRYIVFSAPGLFVMRANGSGITSLPVDGVGETAFRTGAVRRPLERTSNAAARGGGPISAG